MDAIEALAASPAFSARTITLNTIAAECSTSREWHEKVGFPWVPNAPITEHWYERRGYVKYKTAPRYPWTNSRTGEKLLLDGAVSCPGLYDRGSNSIFSVPIKNSS